MSKLATIAIPFYNPGVFFESSIKSVFAQTYKNWELLLVDDGSTDGSLEKALAIKEKRVKVISDGKNKGLVMRLNQISQLAKGEFIARMDADDMMHPERIERQVKLLENSDIDVVDTGDVILDNLTRPVGVRGLSPGLPSAFEILKRGGFLHPSIMAKKSWFLTHLYNPDYIRAEDRELWARSFFDTKFAHLPQPLLFYRFANMVKPQKYLLSYYSERKVITRYGFKMVGVLPSLYLYSRAWLKSFAIIVLTLSRMEQLATKFAFAPIDEELKKEIKILIEKIELVSVPGW